MNETETYGYNGDYLGPVIKVNKGEQVKIHIENGLGDEDTTVHWHGLEVPGDVDGGPHNVIKPKETFSPSFTITQPEATLWYHPHLLHKTGEQVCKGLAGLFYIEDEVSNMLNIPKTYGEDDFPIIIQDRNLRKNGQLTYNLNMMSVMHGIQGDTPLVNGAFDPYLEVPKGKTMGESGGFLLFRSSNPTMSLFKLFVRMTLITIFSFFVATVFSLNSTFSAPSVKSLI